MNEELLVCFDPLDLKRDFFNRRSRGPNSIQEMKDAKYLVLGHFTSSVFLVEIKKRGLLPDTYQERSVRDGDLPSDPCCVYLSVRLDKFYIDRAVKYYGGEGLVVVVKVERTLLEADEQAVAPANRKNLSHNELLYLSLCFGQCKHKGPILPTQIIGIYKPDGNKI
jgi:hypothetical protein